MTPTTLNGSADSPESPETMHRQASTASDTTDEVAEPEVFRGEMGNMSGNMEKKTHDHLIPDSMETLARWSTHNSYTSIRTDKSERGIYGDLPETVIAAERMQSLKVVKSQITDRRYIDDIIPNEDLEGKLQDGSAFLAVDPELVTWDSDDDPANPRNWSPTKKWTMVIVVTLYALVSPLSSSIIAPAISKVSEDLHIEKAIERSLTVSLFVLAWAICPLFTAPLSELWGRRIVLNISIVLLLIFNMATALSKTTAQLLVFRFLAGCAGAPPLSISAGTIADLFTEDERNLAIAIFSAGPTIGPVLAPVISGFIVQNTKWQWVIWVLTMANGAVALIGVILLKETYPPTLLHWKANKLRKETGNSHLHTVFEVTSLNFSQQLLNAITRPIRLLILHPIVMGLGLHMAFIYGFMYLLLVTFPALWIDRYGFSIGISGLMYLSLGIGFFVGLLVWAPGVQYVFHKLTERNNGVSKPEFRLPLLVPSSAIMGIGLIWYGWSAEARIFWLMPCIGTGIFGFGLVCLFQTVQNYLIDMNPRYSASCIAAAAVFRSFFGFGFPLFGHAMIDKLGYGWSNTLSGLLCFVLGVPFPLFVYLRGEPLRIWANKRFQ